MSQFITLAFLPLLTAAIWMLLSRSSYINPIIRNKRICLLIAHPDDEAMFFAPTLLALTRPELGNIVKILCLSTGDADGLGEIRKNELLESGVQLGVKSREDIVVVDDPTKFRDSMAAKWDAGTIADKLAEYYTTGQEWSKNSSKSPIDMVITFDSHGVSQHPNHISLFDGAKVFVKRQRKEAQSNGESIKTPVLYSLRSTNVLRKYSSFSDVLYTTLDCILQGNGLAEMPNSLIFVSDFKQYRRAQQAMTNAHKSQMIWFRWGWIALSRYMVVNDLVKED